MIDQADKTSYFYRFVIGPDPEREDGDKNLSLRELTERTIQELEDRFRTPLDWVAAIHADHTENRHIHAIVVVPGRLQVQDFQQMRSAATEAAQEQRRQLDLARERREVIQELHEGLGLSW